jgi:hypothetical protein
MPSGSEILISIRAFEYAAPINPVMKMELMAMHTLPCAPRQLNRVSEDAEDNAERLRNEALGVKAELRGKRFVGCLPHQVISQVRL